MKSTQLVCIRLPDTMVQRLDRLTTSKAPLLIERYGSGTINRSEVIKEALLLGMRQLEQSKPPPAQGLDRESILTFPPGYECALAYNLATSLSDTYSEDENEDDSETKEEES